MEEFFLKLGRIEGVERELKVESIRNKAVCIVGPRKSGKTWFLRIHARDELYVDLQDIAFRGVKAEEFFKVIEIYSRISGRDVKRVFIDEVQEMDGWENLILSLMNRGYEVFTSGSSSKILRREFSSSLRGKNITLLLLPFSFREFLKAKGFREDVRTSEGRGKVQKLLKDFLLIGGYPEVVLNDERRELLWKSYFEEIFYRDFVERYKIRSIEFGRFLLEFVFQNFSREISINRVKNFLKGKISFTDKTLYEYVGMLEDTLNIFFVKKFSPRVYERMSWPRKIYVADLGIVNILALSEDIGRRMENLVFLELLRKTNENPMLEIYYFKSAQQREVDFALKEGVEVKQLIQVTYASSRDEVEGREIKALLKASELLKCRNLLVITWNYEDELEINGRKIRFSPLWRWLLESATYR